MGLYFITRLYQLKNIVVNTRRHHGNKMMNFYLSLESRVIPTCYRMYFFYTKRRALDWLR